MNTENEERVEDVELDNEELDNQEEKTLENQDGEKGDDNQEETEDLKKKILSLEKQKDHWRTKANGKTDKTKEDIKTPTGMNTGDFYALTKAGVEEEDVEEVIRISKINGTSIKETLKDDYVKTVLKGRVEKRNSADAMNTRTAKKSNKGLSDNEVLNNARLGNVPEAGTNEAEQLFWARRGGKKS